MKNLNSCLLDKVCAPCQGGMPPLDSKASSGLLLELNSGWIINKLGYLYKELNSKTISQFNILNIKKTLLQNQLNLFYKYLGENKLLNII